MRRVNQPRIASAGDIRTDPGSLEHSRPERIDQDVRPFDEAQEDLDPRGVFQIDADRFLAPGEIVAHRVKPCAGRRRAVDTDHFGPEIGEKHAGIRCRCQSSEFYDADAIEWSHS